MWINILVVAIDFFDTNNTDENISDSLLGPRCKSFSNVYTWHIIAVL